MFSRVLIAVDGSECARRAAAFGLELASAYGATVDVLHVVTGDAAGRDVGGTEVDPRQRGERFLDDVASSVEGVAVETHLLEGRPGRVIVDQAEERDADLLVMGRRGRSGLGERLLGSVLERVLRRTAVPVLAVPETTETAPAGFENVLVTTDGSDAAELAAPYGADLARTYAATLHLLTVLDVAKRAGLFDAGGVSAEYVERLRAVASEDVDALAAAAGDLEGLDVVREVVRGRPHEGIREYVEGNEVDLVVMSSQGETRLAGQVLGSVTDRVLRVVRRPVLVVPAP